MFEFSPHEHPYRPAILMKTELEVVIYIKKHIRPSLLLIRMRLLLCKDGLDSNETTLKQKHHFIVNIFSIFSMK